MSHRRSTKHAAGVRDFLFLAGAAGVATVALFAAGIAEERLTAQEAGSDNARVQAEAMMALEDKGRMLQKMQEESAGSGSADVQVILTELQGFYGQMQAASAEPYGEVFWGPNREFDRLTGEFWRALDEVRGEEEDVRNSEQDRKNAERRIKDLQRSTKDQERQLKKLRKYGSVTELEAMIAAQKGIVTELQAILAGSSFDAEAFADLEVEIDDQPIWDALDELRELENAARQEKNAKRLVKEKSRNLKDMKRECKRVKCQGTELEVLLKEFETRIKEMEARLVQNDFEGVEEINSDVDEANMAFWEAMEEFSAKRDVERTLKDLDRELKDIDRTLKNVQRETKKGTFDASAAAEIEQLARNMKAGADRLRKAYNMKDYDTARDEMEEINSMHVELDDLLSPLRDREGGDGEGISEGELEQILTDIAEGERAIDAALTKGATSKEHAGECRGMLAEVNDIVTPLLSAVRKDDQSAIESLGGRLQEVGDSIDSRCGEFLPE